MGLSPLPQCSGLSPKLIQPLTTHAKAWEAIPGVSNWVLNIIKLGSSLQSAHKHPPPRQGRGQYICKEQHGTRPPCRSNEFSSKRSCRNSSTAPQRVGLLQLLFPHPQKGWWPQAHPRPQTEPAPYETAVQDVNIEKTNPLVVSAIGLVSVDLNA